MSARTAPPHATALHTRPAPLNGYVCTRVIGLGSVDPGNKRIRLGQLFVQLVGWLVAVRAVAVVELTGLMRQWQVG